MRDATIAEDKFLNSRGRNWITDEKVIMDDLNTAVRLSGVLGKDVFFDLLMRNSKPSKRARTLEGNDQTGKRQVEA